MTNSFISYQMTDHSTFTYPKSTPKWLCNGENVTAWKNPNLRYISFLSVIDAHRVSIKNTSCICDYFLPDYLFMYILYDNYFDTPNNALNMLDNIWGFFCKLVWRVCHLMKRLVQRNIFTRLEMKPKQLLYVIFPAYKCFNWEVFSVIEFYITNHRGHFKHWYLKYYKNVNTEQWLYLALLN